MQKLPSVCTSSRSVIQDIVQLTLPTTSNCVILCADVKRLYPSIPIEYGVKAVYEVLQQFSLSCDINIPLIIDLLQWTLQHNFLEFEGIIYRQRTGTAMGTPVAVCYANIVLYQLEKPCLEQRSVLYKRFIDDLFVVMESFVEANNLVRLFNQQCASIQLDAVTIAQEGIFLDMRLRIDNGRIGVQLYQKPMNKYLYIPPLSAHNPKLLGNIIRQEIKRYRLYSEIDQEFIDMRI